MGFSVKFVFGIFGNISSLCLFLAPIPTFCKIYKNKSTEEYSGLPYVVTLLSCLICTWYGLPFISSNNILVSTVNGTGAAIELLYVFIYVYCAPKHQKVRMFKLLCVVALILAAITSISITVLHGNKRKLMCGSLLTIFVTLTYASPLSIMRLVIKTKSVKYMPLFLSVGVFLCGSSWLVFGLLGKDIFIVIPNSIGTVLGIAQLLLYARYRLFPAKVEHKSSNGEGSVDNIKTVQIRGPDAV